VNCLSCEEMEGLSNDMKRGSFSALRRGYMRLDACGELRPKCLCLGIHDVAHIILTMRTLAHSNDW
jgi:hypothetical protein